MNAAALNFKERPVYYPAERPGYTAWVSLFPFGGDELGLVFNEIRRGENPAFAPAPLEAVEAMNLPYRFLPVAFSTTHPNLVSEHVTLKSIDRGATWEETGRCPAPSRHAYHVGRADGRIVRMCMAGRWVNLNADSWGFYIEESMDGGSTWKRLAHLLEESCWFAHRMKRLRDGTIIAVGSIWPTFGEGAQSPQRLCPRPGQKEDCVATFFASADDGYNWTGPHYVLPLTGAHEYDFVETPDGDLLFFLSTVQSNPPARQLVHRRNGRFVNDMLMEVRRGAPTDDNPQGGFTPETIVIRPDGLIVGGRRGMPYVCSNDLGANWYEIADAPVAAYQPMMILLDDDSVLTAAHHGHDGAFGEVDMFIKTHRFTVEAELPIPTRLDLQRDLAPDGRRYVNTFTAVLTAGGKPLESRTLELCVSNIWLPQPDGSQNPVPVEASPDVRTAVTDAQGAARFVLEDKEQISDIHHAYQVMARFEPDQDDGLTACRSFALRAYAMRPARNAPAPYPVYTQHGMIMITPQTAECFPDLAAVVEHFRTPDPAGPIEKWIAAAGDEKRAREIVDFLLANHILHGDEEGVYHWCRAVHDGGSGDPYVHEVRVCEVAEYCC